MASTDHSAPTFNCRTNFLENIKLLLLADKFMTTVEEKRTTLSDFTNTPIDHSYCFRTTSNHERNEAEIQLDIDSEDGSSKDARNPMKYLKPQFIIGNGSMYVNPLIASFDVACIEEFYPDGSPVDKMYVFSSCGIHGIYDKWCPMCTSLPSSKPSPGTEKNNAFLKCISNKINCNTQSKSHPRKRSESLDDSENVNKNQVLELSDLRKNIHNKQPFTCEICEKQFTVLATLKNHYRSHGKIKMHKCSLCGSSFTRKFGLRYHMQIHNNKFRFSCSVCSKQFRHTTHFKAHCKTHFKSD